MKDELIALLLAFGLAATLEVGAQNAITPDEARAIG